MGNVFTHYNYTTTDVHQAEDAKGKEISSEKSKFKININKQGEEVSLPHSSPFSNWKEARRFAGPLPFTFTYNEQTKEVLIIEGVRRNWKPKPVDITNYDFDFINSMNFKNHVLANAFVVENIPYSWKKGTIELWK